MRNGGQVMDIRRICEDLSDRWPEWSERISLLQFLEADGVGAAANDGRSVIYNDRLMSYYTQEHQSFYVAQQIMHLQLNHFARGKGRDPLLWKRASDAVVNALLKADGFDLPEDAVYLADAAEQSAEGIYEALLEDAEQNNENEALIVREVVLPQSESKQAGKETDAQTRTIDDPGLAAVVAGLAELLEPSMQMDFDWFPGMTIRDGVLGHEFRPYPVAHAEILLDTSASVDAALLRAFVRGVKGLMRQDAVVRVGCFDTRFYGFHDIHTDEDIQNLKLSGAGGTDFHTAVAAFSGDAENRIIFTDGFAEMPEQRCDAIWVVYGNAVIHPKGGRVLYVRPTEEREKHEIDFLIT